MSRPNRIGGQPKAEDILAGMHKAIEEILSYLEQAEQQAQNEAFARLAKLKSEGK